MVFPLWLEGNTGKSLSFGIDGDILLRHAKTAIQL
jgi:hypothetical protein